VPEPATTEPEPAATEPEPTLPLTAIVPDPALAVSLPVVPVAVEPLVALLPLPPIDEVGVALLQATATTTATSGAAQGATRRHDTNLMDDSPPQKAGKGSPLWAL
jgi:hypothetical protein